MTDPREALHTAARRYCMERESATYEQIKAEVERERGLRTLRQAFDKAAGLDGRRDIVVGILRRVEAVDPAAFPSIEALREFLVETGRVASLEEDTRPLKEMAGMWVSRNEPSKAAERARADERARFSAYIESLRAEDPYHIQPVPHRRLLSEREAERLWRRLRRKWQIPSKGYWWPLGSQDAPPSHVLAFNGEEFDDHVPLPLLRDWLRDARARLVLLFDNDNPGEDYEVALELFVPGGSEQYWTSPKMDWVIYWSHEDSITVGGEWLLNLVKRAWPEWADHLRTTHYPPSMA